MRKYLLVILFLSIGFGQDVLTTKEGIEYKGKMIEAGHYEVKFKGEGMPSPQNVKIEIVQSLILSDGTEIVKNGFLIRDSFVKEEISKIGNFLIRDSSAKEEISEMSNFFSNVGGALIGISGILLYYNNQRTIDENSSIEEIENFADKSKSNADLAFVLITIGGALIAISK